MSSLPSDRANRPFEIVVWGATGFTGRLVAEHLATRGPDVRWAMAGRSRDKLEAVRSEIASRAPSAREVPLLIGDATDAASLRAITAQTRVVCSTVGPFARHGEPLVAACVDTGTDYCDSTGEPHFVRRVIDAHHDRARAASVRVVPCCGFDSVPSDLGALVLADHARQHQGRALAEVRAYVTAARGGFSGGTAHTMLDLLDAAAADRTVRRQLADPYGLSPDREHDLTTDGYDDPRPRWDPDAGGWSAPWMMAAINTRVVRRSNALLGHAYGASFRYGESLLMRGRIAGAAKAGAITAAMGLGMVVLSKSALARSWAGRALPSSGEGPSPAAREAGFFKMRFYATLEGDARASLVARLEGKGDPGYLATSRMLGESSLSLARDERAEGFEGGVLTPATALGMRLVERLRRVEITYDIEER